MKLSIMLKEVRKKKKRKMICLLKGKHINIRKKTMFVAPVRLFSTVNIKGNVLENSS